MEEGKDKKHLQIHLLTQKVSLIFTLNCSSTPVKIFHSIAAAK
jgi:hypothetical protein